jgi:hypothetical protein
MNGTRWGALGCTLREGFAAAAGLALGVWALALALDGASGLLRAYRGAVLRLESERWMLENCRDPVFFAQMRAHTSVCAEVEASARIGALGGALREVSARLSASDSLAHPLGVGGLGATGLACALLAGLACVAAGLAGLAACARPASSRLGGLPYAGKDA